MAMGRSNPGPSLRRLTGERLTTTRRSGHSSPELSTAGLTLSLASWTVAPGRPVRQSAGSPRPMCASTTTRCPWTPTTVPAFTLPYTAATVARGSDSAAGRGPPRGGRSLEGVLEDLNVGWVTRTQAPDADHVE